VPTRRDRSRPARAPRRDTRPSRHPHRQQGGGWASRLTIVGVLVLLIGGAFAALAYAAGNAKDRVPKGATVGGVDIGGMTRQAALDRLDEQVGKPASRPVRVKVAGETYKLSAKSAGVQLDFTGAVDGAIAAANDGSFVERGWHAITGSSTGKAHDVAVPVDTKAVRSFVDRIAERVDRPAKDASLDISVTSVGVTKAKSGRELADTGALVKRIVRKFRARGTNRRLVAETESVKPQVTTKALLAKTPTVVTVSKSSTTVRVFKGGKLDKTYSVAVGSAEYPTPEGQFSVQSMQVNPTWNVPTSSWAGGLAGQTIPGGDPRNPLVARWIGFNGSVGFHGTKEAGSIGSAASHGCVRMNPTDVIDLYKRVEVGTPVLVAA
jgi:lipoprotein-anchoring transpeptidase ErfK/SrfK